MLLKKIDVYFRKFSQISGLQNEELVKYRLCKTEEKNFTTYGIEIISLVNSGNKESSKEALERISCSKETVLGILKYLYENSIRPDSARCIVADILNTNKIFEESALVLS